MTTEREKVEEAFGNMVHPLAVMGVHGNEAEKELANKIAGLILAHNRGGTKPAAGEPIHQWADQDLWMDGDEADLASARAEGFKTRTLWTAPPAAAHGDEAVRKDAERYRWLRDEFLADDPALIGLEPGDEEDTLNGAIDAAMRAQAGEGGEL